MEKKANQKTSKSNRRSFIRNIALGAVGFPFFTFASKEPKDELFENQYSQLKENGKINWKSVRNQFLLRPEKHYLNTASLGPSPKIVLETICDEMEALETVGEHGREKTDETHTKIARFLNCSADEIALTRNTTEGINIVARSLRLKKSDEVILSKHEHIGGTAPWLALQKDIGIKIVLIDLDLSGEKNLEILKAAITKRTRVVSLSHITCTTGLVLPVKEIAAFCRKREIYTCIDGAQALGMLPIDLQDINPDFYASSGHKWLFGPKGTGILFINKNVIGKCSPVFAGAYTNCTYDLDVLEMEYRETAQREEYGTRNTPITLGLGAAFDFIDGLGIKNVEERGLELAGRFKKHIKNNSAIEILSPAADKYASSIITIRLANVDYKKALDILQTKYDFRLRGIYENDLNAIRISFSIFNSMEEVDALSVALAEIVENKDKE